MVRCTVCKGTNVEYAVWQNPNTGEVGDTFGSWNAGDNTFCRDCDAEGRDPNPDLIDEDVDGPLDGVEGPLDDPNEAPTP